MPTHEHVWHAVLAYLQDKLRKGQFETWFNDVHLVSYEPDSAELEVPNNFYRE